MTPTKIKARKMWHTNHVLTDERLLPDSKPVYVLDASRYGEMVEQMAKATRLHAAMAYAMDQSDAEEIARAALRSIGITKGA